MPLHYPITTLLLWIGCFALIYFVFVVTDKYSFVLKIVLSILIAFVIVFGSALLFSFVNEMDYRLVVQK